MKGRKMRMEIFCSFTSKGNVHNFKVRMSMKLTKSLSLA